MQKAWKIILILSIVINFILGFILINMPKEEEYDFDVYIEKINSLELELSSLKQVRDSVRNLIDTVFIKISDNEKDYEETHNIILSNNVTEDYLFFTEYLRQNKLRLDSINNP